MKRKLNEDELKLSQKSLMRLKDEVEYNDYQVKICDLKLETGLMTEYKKNLRDYKTLRKEFKSELDRCKKQISVLTDQIRNGVEILKEKDEENKVEKEVNDNE